MNKGLVKEAKEVPIASQYASILVVVGLAIIMFVLGYAIYLSTVATDYYVLTKATRDGAVAGSVALGQLELLRSAPAWLEPLKFSGLAILVAGIGLVLSSIITTLRVRGRVMAEALPKLIGGESK